MKSNNVIESLKTELLHADSVVKYKDFEIFSLKAEIDKLNDKISVKDIENKSLRMMGFHANPMSMPVQIENIKKEDSSAAERENGSTSVGNISQETLRQIMVKSKAARKKKVKEKVETTVKEYSHY